MAIQKPSKPDVILPNNFGGTKTPYTDSQISNGYQEAVPQVVDGGNINWEKDGIFKYFKYLKTVVDALVDMPIGKSIVIDANNRFEYISPENSANKTGTINASSTATQYPTAKAVYDVIKDFNPSLFQLISNLEQSLSQSTTKYPCSKAVQDAVNTKQATIKGAATTITSANLTTNRALIANGSGKVAVSAVTSTELGYLGGVTSSIQTQLNGKANTALSNISSNIDYIVESGGNDSKWYKKYKSGWIHQGGLAVLSSKTPSVISLLKPMANSSYVICVAGYGTSISDGTGQLIANVTTTSFSFANNATNANAGNSSWLIIGKAQ